MAVKLNLKALSRADLEELVASMDEPRYRADQIFGRIHRHRALQIAEFTELSLEMRRRLAEVADLPTLRAEHRALAPGGTEKFILGLGGATASSVEAVWIVGLKRRTVCVSSQAGCSLDCSFCATGRIPFKGNLEAWQIVDQVYELERLRGERATNVVFMGMGEPFHNYDNVLAAAALLCDEDGASLGKRRITISTAGVLPSIDRFTDEAQPYRLAISLNHSDPEQRQRIMPIDRRYPLEELLSAARRYTEVSGRRVTFEYVMIDGVNMSDVNMQELARIGRSLKCKVNLIPLNTALEGFRRPSAARSAEFRSGLAAAGVDVYDRGSPGREVAGACGMLALDRQSGENVVDTVLDSR